MSYFSNVNSTILELISPDARRICEFGCGSGALARKVRETNPTVYYVGIDLVEEQLRLAVDVLNEGLQRDLDQIRDWALDSQLSSLVPESSFDYVILGDVLEHLFEPEKTMRQATCLLNEGGTALVCIPNVQHWSVFANLIGGTWPKEDSGLFDRTHIRWFTLDDMIRLLTNSGLKVETVLPRVFESEIGLSILEDLEALALNIGVDPNELIRRGLALQYVLVGRKVS